MNFTKPKHAVSIECNECRRELIAVGHKPYTKGRLTVYVRSLGWAASEIPINGKKKMRYRCLDCRKVRR